MEPEANALEMDSSSLLDSSKVGALSPENMFLFLSLATAAAPRCALRLPETSSSDSFSEDSDDALAAAEWPRAGELQAGAVTLLPFSSFPAGRTALFLLTRRAAAGRLLDRGGQAPWQGQSHKQGGRRHRTGGFVILTSLGLPGGVKSGVFLGIGGRDGRLLVPFLLNRLK